MRRSGIDHEIKLEKVNRKDIKVLLNPLYNISRGKFLILKKKLIKLLDKRFIKINKLATKTPVLFIYKSNKRFQFCVNYKILNKIIRKNYYLLSLI